MERGNVIRAVLAVAVIVLVVVLAVLDRSPVGDAPAAQEVGEQVPEAVPSTSAPTAPDPSAPAPSTTAPGEPVPTPPEGIEAIACEQLRRDVALTVVSLNTHRSYGANGMERIARELARLDPDVVLLQEIDRFFPRTRMVDQSTWFADRLDMEVAFGANVRRGRSEYGVATLSRFDIVGARNTLLPNAPGGEQRGLLRVTLELGDQRVNVYNTHLQNRMPALRDRQARVVAATLAADPLPLVLGGDLNAGPATPALRSIRGPVVDGFLRAGSGPGATHGGGARIDYVLASPHLRPTSSRVYPSSVSDHHALRTTYRFSVGPDCDRERQG